MEREAEKPLNIKRRDLADDDDSYKVRINNGNCQGRVVPPIAPINMTTISDRKACVKRGGPNFLDTTRVDPKTGRCPIGLVTCSPFTSQTDTVCMKESELGDCPIIDLFVVHESMTSYLRENGFSITSTGYPQEGGF